MNDLPRQTLSRIIARHGVEICDAPKRVEAILRDLCGAYRREINIIMGALEERVVGDLTAAGNSVPREVLVARLAARLRDNLAYTPEAARWGVETWAVALGVISEAELQERMRKEPAESGQDSAPTPVRDPESARAHPARVSPPAPQPQHNSTNTPPRQPPQQPSVQLPAPRKVPRQPASINLPQPPEQDISPSLPSRQTLRRGLTMRSCLTIAVLIIVLIIAAVFVVPAIITILREEQARPSINEPRAR